LPTILQFPAVQRPFPCRSLDAHSWPVIKAILQDLPWTTALRSIIGTAILFAISALRRSVVLPKSGDIPVVLNIALLHMVAFTGLVSIGLQFVPAGRSVVLGYTTPAP
jgi:drug/metabolite transporter (DMT)-like permease